jgi:hypothetical protein
MCWALVAEELHGSTRLDLEHQPPRLSINPREPQDLRRRTEIKPVKNSHTEIKTLPLASGHGRYITVTTERELFSVGEWPLPVAVINL